MRLVLTIAALLLLLSETCTASVTAGEPNAYTPPGLYDVEVVHFTNGLRVLLKNRPESKNVAIRLVMGLGLRDFGCEQRETPHLLEHLLMGGTTRHTEAELNSLIEEQGGTWNGTAGPEQTVYQVDIFDRYVLTGIDVLQEIMTSADLDASKVARAKDIVYREEGGRPTFLRRIFYRVDIGKRAWKKADEWLLPGTGAVCPGLTNLENITTGDLRAAYRDASSPANLTLIVVGNYSRPVLLEHLRDTFGAMAPVQTGSRHAVTTPPFPTGGPKVVSSLLAPFLGSNGSISIAFRTEGRDSADAPAIEVLAKLLDEELYDRVRVKSGLSYAPEAVAFLRPDYGIFYLTADIAPAREKQVRELFEATLRQVRETPPGPEEVERAKRKILLQWVQGYETNAGFADYYAGHLAELESGGRFRNYETAIGAVTAADVQRVVERYLRPESGVTVRSLPTLTYTLFFMIVGAVLAAVGLAVLLVLRLLARRRSKRKILSPYLR